MLKHLYIKNYALIDVLDIDFRTGFSVITGETGAGKSIILGAIGLLLGQRADSKTVKTNSQKCTIEARFDISKYDMKAWFVDNDLDCDEDECILRRELTATGKSRAFINDTPVQLTLMRELGEMLVDVHSQHQNLLLQKEDFQLNVIDIIAENNRQRDSYTKAFCQYKEAKNRLETLREQIEQARENEEFMRFQLNELNNASLKNGEQEELEQEQETAAHTEEIKTILFETNALLNDDNSGIMVNLKTASQKMQSAASLLPRLKELAERLDSAFIEMKDIAQETESVAEGIDFDPARLEYINERLDTIYTLQRKFRKNTVAELLEEQQRLQEAVDNIDNGDTTLAEQEALTEKLLSRVKEQAEILTASRNKALKKVEQAVCDTLAMLGMPKIDFNVDMSCGELTPKGQDRVAFLFSANKGMALRPVAQVASGGEIARLMLALKALISTAVKLPTIIFDEIDTGVSGRVAEKMADIMTRMGKADRQVISITHLPQIAAKGHNHYKVEKHETEEGTTSVMRQLNDEERIDEIAQMLSGSNITEAARTNAKTLLQN